MMPNKRGRASMPLPRLLCLAFSANRPRPVAIIPCVIDDAGDVMPEVPAEVAVLRHRRLPGIGRLGLDVTGLFSHVKILLLSVFGFVELCGTVGRRRLPGSENAKGRNYRTRGQALSAFLALFSFELVVRGVY